MNQNKPPPLITSPTEQEMELFTYARMRPKRMSGVQIKQLFIDFGIGGNFAADLAAYYLGYTRQAIQAMMSRTIRTNDYELLRFGLSTWSMTSRIKPAVKARIRPVQKRKQKQKRKPTK